MNPLLKPFALKKPIKKAKSPRTKIRRRTKSRAKDEAIYRKRVKEWLVGKLCMCCHNLAEVCHHSAGRRLKLLLFEPLWKPLCNHHHRQVHAYPIQARQAGLLCDVGQFNNQSLIK